MKRIIFLILAGFISINTFGFEYSLFPKKPQKGTVSFLELKSKVKPKLFLKKQKLPVFFANGSFWVLIALDISYSKKDITLKVQRGDATEYIKFAVKNFPYRVRRLQFPFRTKKFFKKEEILKYKEITKLVHRVRSKRTSNLYFYKNFIYPLKKVRKSDLYFGDQRIIYFGKRKRRPYFHRGVDFAAVKGTKVFASNTGRVVLARNLYRRGKAVIVDHGWGVFTEYLHLSKILVREGQYVPQGHVVGEVGNSGISTGAHLHWSLVVNGLLVNPLTLVKKGIAKNLKRSVKSVVFKEKSRVK